MPFSSRSSSTWLGAQRKHREHAVLPVDIGEPLVIGGEARAKAADASAHLVELGLPVGAQLRILENDMDERRAMVGRHRPHGARQLEEVAVGDLRRPRARGLDEEIADPLAIDPEILVAALRDQRLLGRLDHHPGARRIRLEPVAEALISEVDEGNEAAPDDQLGQRPPLVGARGRRRSDCGSSRGGGRGRRRAPSPAPPSSRRTGSGGSAGRNRDGAPSRPRREAISGP